jgi:hypothetical protein
VGDHRRRDGDVFAPSTRVRRRWTKIIFSVSPHQRVRGAPSHGGFVACGLYVVQRTDSLSRAAHDHRRLVVLTVFWDAEEQTMDDHAARNPSPYLSAAERETLAQRIAAMDGVTLPQAHRQIEEFLSLDFGPTSMRTAQSAAPQCTA